MKRENRKRRVVRRRYRPLRCETLEDRRLLAAVFSQGFEADNSGWFDDAVRVSSGADGVPSESGGFHAEVLGGPTATPSTPHYSAYTKWGGYSSEFPVEGYTTSIGIYLDMGTTADNDTRFDFSSAISTPAGTHRRDFIFNAGFYNDSDAATGSGPRFVISASNNSVGQPKSAGRSPITIDTTGWYTFQHRFYDSGGGVLAVDMSVLNPSGTTVGTWTLSNSTDVIGSTVGGNRYGWFANNQFPFLAIDNTFIFQEAADTVYVDDDWAGMAVGGDPDGDGPATLFGYDAFATIQDAVDAVAAAGTVDVAAGSYAEDVAVGKSLTLDGANAGVSAGASAGVRGPESELTGGFRLTASDVTIDGFTILGGVGVGGGDVAAVYLAGGGSGHVIRNNVVTGARAVASCPPTTAATTTSRSRTTSSATGPRECSIRRT